MLSHGADATLNGRCFDSSHGFNGNAASYAAKTGNIDMIMVFQPLYRLDGTTGEKRPFDIPEEASTEDEEENDSVTVEELGTSAPTSDITYMKIKDGDHVDKRYLNDYVDKRNLAKSLDQLNKPFTAPSKPPRRFSQGPLSKSTANVDQDELPRLYPRLMQANSSGFFEDNFRREKEAELEAALALQVKMIELQEAWIERREQLRANIKDIEERLESAEKELKREEADYEFNLQTLKSDEDFRTDEDVAAIMKELEETVEDVNNGKQRRLNCPSCKRKIGHIYGCVKCDSMLCAVCSVSQAKCYNCQQEFKVKPPRRNILAEKLL